MHTRAALAIFALAAAPWAAYAGCSRPIEAPVAPIGLSIVVKENQVSGVFPEFIQSALDAAGCSIRMHPVPRARVEVMFEQGSADMLLAATHSERRDEFGQFVPLLQTRAVLLSLDGPRPAIHSIAELLAQRSLRLAVVRGFDYGPAYRGLVEQLTQQKRIYLQKDPLEIARMLKAGMVDATIMPASALYGAAIGDARVSDIAARLRFEPLDELPWTQAGVYLSLRALTPADRQTLDAALTAAAKGQALLQAYRRYYPAYLVAAGTRPL
ncbi:MAG: substrate-binding periplasmic protein [Telluria sp.]